MQPSEKLGYRAVVSDEISRHNNLSRFAISNYTPPFDSSAVKLHESCMRHRSSRGTISRLHCQGELDRNLC